MRGLMSFKNNIMARQMRVGVKAAIIGGIFLVIAAIIGVIFNKTNNRSEPNNQEVKQQKVDSGSIENYNAERDIKVENNYYQQSPSNDTVLRPDTVVKYIKTPPVQANENQKTTIKEQTNVTSNNQTGGQTAKEIINNKN